jgi:hypothetical protein
MSVALGLYAEFSSVTARNQFYGRFPVHNFPLLTGGTIRWEVECWLPSCGGYAVTAHSPDLPDQGIHSVKSAVEHTAIGFRLFHLLYGAFDLLFARVGFEAMAFTSCELANFVDKKTGYLKLDDCILSEELYTQLGRPLGLSRFNARCYWTQWQGVTYDPLYGDDEVELRQLVNELFPSMNFQG